MVRDNIPDDIKVCSCRNEFHLLELHDILKLHTDFSCLAQQLRVQEMADTPFVPIPITPLATSLAITVPVPRAELTLGSSTG